MKATDHLLNDHKMIRKVLLEFHLDHPRFPHFLKTLHRIVVGHAWFEDEIFLPAFEAEPLLQKRLTSEIIQEHKDIDAFFKILKKTPDAKTKERAAVALQLVTVLKTHFEKEEEAFFPLAEKILDNEGMNNLGAEMERRKTEVRGIVKD